MEGLAAENQALSAIVLRLQHDIGVEQATNTRLHLSLSQMQVRCWAPVHPRFTVVHTHGTLSHTHNSRSVLPAR